LGGELNFDSARVLKHRQINFQVLEYILPPYGVFEARCIAMAEPSCTHVFLIPATVEPESRGIVADRFHPTSSMSGGKGSTCVKHATVLTL
jgi:hypothetical protein